MAQKPSMNPAIIAACDCLRRHGIEPDRSEVLQDAHTIVVRLTRSLVARIVTDTQGPRQGTTWFTRETAIAAHLTEHRAPIIPLHLDTPPKAHVQNGFVMNFWQYVTLIDAQPDPIAIGASLAQCHQILATFPEPLPALGILHESCGILEQQSVRDALPRDTIRMLLRHLCQSIEILSTLPHQVLHGDAHPGNLMMTTRGLLWTDWEDAFSGPIEWDLASVIWNSHLLENDQRTVAVILKAYETGGTNINRRALDQSLIARAAVMSAWYPVLYPNPSAERVLKLEHRLRWLESMG
ncbi:MAG: phosphotransferase enzyme family protein [Akkermansiaceae bacterium]